LTDIEDIEDNEPAMSIRFAYPFVMRWTRENYRRRFGEAMPCPVPYSRVRRPNANTAWEYFPVTRTMFTGWFSAIQGTKQTLGIPRLQAVMGVPFDRWGTPIEEKAHTTTRYYLSIRWQQLAVVLATNLKLSKDGVMRLPREQKGWIILDKDAVGRLLAYEEKHGWSVPNKSKVKPS